MAFYNASFFVKDFVDVDVTRVSFEFSDLESSVRENIEADSFWCMTKVIVINLSFRPNNPTIYDADIIIMC